MSLTLSSPESCGFHQSDINNISLFFKENYLDTGKLSGFSYLIARSGKIASLEYQGSGVMGKSALSSSAICEESLFRIFSMTKPITSFALMLLVEDGVLRLNDNVKTYLPSFSDMEVWEQGTVNNYTTTKPSRDITLHDLVTHQSGLTYHFLPSHPVDALYRRHKISTSRPFKYSLDDFVNLVSERPLLFSPGTSWNYSVGLEIIGRVIEVASGQSLEDFFKSRIFIPLSMSDTSFNLASDSRHRLTNCYQYDVLKNKIIDYDTPSSPIFWNNTSFFSGGGGLISSLPDYYRFCRMLLQGGFYNGKQLLGSQYVKQMLSNNLPNNHDLPTYGQGYVAQKDNSGNGFGIGGLVVLDSNKKNVHSSVGNYSWSGMCNTHFTIDPVEDMTIIFMSQFLPTYHYSIFHELQNLVYSALRRF